MLWLLEKIGIGQKKEVRIKTILVIDPEEEYLDFVQKALTAHGFCVLISKGGQEGLEIAAREDLDMVILECDLPDIKGLEVCRLLKESPDSRKVPVLFFTVIQDGYTILQCYGAGADGFLNKPVNARQLVSTVDVLLQEENEMASRVSGMKSVV